jgi:hypothetical protein
LLGRVDHSHNRRFVNCFAVDWVGSIKGIDFTNVHSVCLRWTGLAQEPCKHGFGLKRRLESRDSTVE